MVSHKSTPSWRIRQTMVITLQVRSMPHSLTRRRPVVWIRSAICLFLVGVLVLLANAQESRDSVGLQPVKYTGLMDAVNQNRGKVVVVDFWGNFCVPCKQNFPHTLQLHRKY